MRYISETGDLMQPTSIVLPVRQKEQIKMAGYTITEVCRGAVIDFCHYLDDEDLKKEAMTDGK